MISICIPRSVKSNPKRLCFELILLKTVTKTPAGLNIWKLSEIKLQA
ncbi:hypothetical protein NC652_007373 [Populus alba x Populus x berolinensis]|nr:hypothetical protein NC652_007373 [Populus alba x Populus x berolinensis]